MFGFGIIYPFHYRILLIIISGQITLKLKHAWYQQEESSFIVLLVEIQGAKKLFLIRSGKKNEPSLFRTLFYHQFMKKKRNWINHFLK
jgi:hypothetical protein